jgi:hypothetical protein
MSRGEMVWRVLITAVLLTTLSAIVIVQSNADEKKNDGKIAFIVEQEFDHWRVSRLIGVGVFDPQGEKIGSVSEVLVDHINQSINIPTFFLDMANRIDSKRA